MVVSLNVFLFSQNIVSIDLAKACVSDGYRTLRFSETIQLENGINEKMFGLIKSNNNENVGWVEVFREFFEIENISNNTHSFIFLYKFDQNNELRVFAFTAGYGWTGIDKSKIVGDFGIKVSLNLLSDQDITLIDTKKISLSSHQSREVSSQRSSFYDFVFDTDEEFMDRIAGVPLDDDMIKRVNGRDSLKVEVSFFNNENIDVLCEKLLTLYNSNDYQDNFSFIDNIKEVKDSRVKDHFISHLDSLFLARNFGCMKIIYPDIEECNKYSYRLKYPGRDQIESSDFGIDTLTSFVETIGTGFEYDKLKISLIDENNREIDDKKRNLLEYLVVEFDMGEKKYLYSAKKIFEIAPDFFNEVNDFVRNHYQDKNYIKLKYKIENNKIVVEKEEEYNERLKDDLNNSYNLDQNLYSIRGRNNIEMCDVLTQEKEFICVKKYVNSSSSISHLFSQVIASAETLTNDDGIIEWLNSRTRASFFSENDKNNRAITFVLGITINKDGGLCECLPFLAQVSLRRVIKFVKSLGYSVYVTKIEFEEDNMYNYD